MDNNGWTNALIESVSPEAEAAPGRLQKYRYANFISKKWNGYHTAVGPMYDIPASITFSLLKACVTLNFKGTLAGSAYLMLLP